MACTLIGRSDLTFFYTASNTVFNNSLMTGSVGDLFRSSTGIALTDKAHMKKVLDIYVKVDYPPTAVDPEVSLILSLVHGIISPGKSRMALGTTNS